MALEWLAALLSLVGRQQRSAAAPAPRPQHNAAFALYGLSDNEDNLLEFVREGAVQVRRCAGRGHMGTWLGWFPPACQPTGMDVPRVPAALL